MDDSKSLSPNLASQDPMKSQVKAEKKIKQKKNKADKEGSTQNINKQNSGDKSKNIQNSSDNAAGDEPKSKAQLKAERRAIQEAQRAAKTKTKAEAVEKSSNVESSSTPKKPVQTDKTRKRLESVSKSRIPDFIQMDDDKTSKRVSKRYQREQVPRREPSQWKVKQLMHLPQYEKDLYLTKSIKFISNGNIHPSIIKLGLQFADGIILDSNARCIAFLAAIKQVILNYSTPDDKDLSRDLEKKIGPNITFLNQCRQNSTSMGNAIKFLKWQISNIHVGMAESDAKEQLLQSIDDFIKIKIIYATEAISKNALQKIQDDDVLLLYACSPIICKVVIDAHVSGKKFKVIVVDSRPKLEGKTLLKKLIEKGINCSYVLINAVSYIIPDVTKVFLGAHAILANGYIMARVGTSQIAMVAKAFNVPVIFCCLSYKFSEKVQTDSFVYNELGDPTEIVNESKQKDLCEWKSKPQMRLLNLVYDVSPPDIVSAIITELGILPCSSAPVLLRVKPLDTNDYR